MKKTMLTLLAAALSAIPAHAQVNVFACGPEWASLVREVGGDRVSVFTATTVRQDPHTIAAKPSLIAQMRRSDLVIGSGA